MGHSQSQKARGKLRPRDGIPYQTASRLPAANQVFLGSWTADILQEGRSQRSAPQRRHTVHLRRCSRCAPRKPRLGRGGGKTHRPPGESALAKHPVAGAARTWEGHKTQAQPSVPLWTTREPGPEQPRPGKCTQPRALLRQVLQSNLEPEQRRPGKRTRREWRQTQRGPDTARAPHAPVTFVCSAPPSPRHD